MRQRLFAGLPAPMVNVLDLSPADFRNYLAESQSMHGYTPDRINQLRAAYRHHNSLSGALDRAGEQGLDGMNTSTFLPLAGPQGMSIWDALKSGQAQTRFKDWATDAVGAVVRGVENPRNAWEGLLSPEEMNSAAMETAAMAMLGGGAVPKPKDALGANALRDDSGFAALPNPRNQAEAQAKVILELRAEGRASEVTDKMMAQADPQYMFDHTPLPMDEVSRLARAREMGFDADGLHGTTLGGYKGMFDAFDKKKGLSSETYIAPNTQEGAELIAQFNSADTGASMPVMHRGNLLDTSGLSGAAIPREEKQAWNILGKTGDYSGLPHWSNFKAINSARDAGYDGIKLEERDWVNSAAIFEPANIRSRFARFDPEFSGLSNLTAANANASTGALVLGMQAKAEPRLAKILADRGIDPSNADAAPLSALQDALDTAASQGIIDPRSASSTLSHFADRALQLEDFYANASKGAGVLAYLTDNAGEMPPTSSFGASKIDKLLMDKKNSININSVKDFTALAARGKLRTAKTTKQDIADIVKKKMLATVINLRAADDNLSMQYETGKITQKLEDAGLFVDDDGMGIIHVGTTQENLDAIKQAKTPLEIGRLSGYSDEDIAAFYLKRRGGAEDIAFEEYKTDRGSL